MTDQPFTVWVDELLADVSRRLSEANRSGVPTVAPALAIAVWVAGSPCYAASAG